MIRVPFATSLPKFGLLKSQFFDPYSSNRLDFKRCMRSSSFDYPGWANVSDVAYTSSRSYVRVG